MLPRGAEGIVSSHGSQPAPNNATSGSGPMRWRLPRGCHYTYTLWVSKMDQERGPEGAGAVVDPCNTTLQFFPGSSGWAAGFWPCRKPQCHSLHPQLKRPLPLKLLQHSLRPETECPLPWLPAQELALLPPVCSNQSPCQAPCAAQGHSGKAQKQRVVGCCAGSPTCPACCSLEQQDQPSPAPESPALLFGLGCIIPWKQAILEQHNY